MKKCLECFVVWKINCKFADADRTFGSPGLGYREAGSVKMRKNASEIIY